MEIKLRYTKSKGDRPDWVYIIKDGVEVNVGVDGRYYTVDGLWYSDDCYGHIATSEADFIETMKGYFNNKQSSNYRE